MKRLLFLLLLASGSVSAEKSQNRIHLSPSIKISEFRGADIQLGLTDVWTLDAVYLSYGESWNDADRYDEKARFYRVGLQHMFEHIPNAGFQAEIGMATYKGDKYSNNVAETKESLGLSIAGAYVYQINPNLGFRSGFDYSIFGQEKTHIYYGDSLLSFNLGFLLRF
ncbi:MAG: hypothetical protein V7782_13690 [Psychromonas sp.]